VFCCACALESFFSLFKEAITLTTGLAVSGVGRPEVVDSSIGLASTNVPAVTIKLLVKSRFLGTDPFGAHSHRFRIADHYRCFLQPQISRASWLATL